jgi:hypothetical protein
MRKHSFEVSSTLSVPAADFWAAATLGTVNSELAPWVRMTAPPEWMSCPLHQWRTGARLFKSWILLLGFLPVDLHFFFLETVMPGSGFEERSSSVMNRLWHHTRRVVPHPGGCRVSDRVEFESRLPLVGTLLLPVYRAIFASRHRYLRRTYGRGAA